MLTNRIVRALIGVVFAKAAVATSWYLYQKSLKDNETSEKEGETGSADLNELEATPRVHDLSPALAEVEDYKQASQALKNAKTSQEAANAQATLDGFKVFDPTVVTQAKPKRVRRTPKANATTETASTEVVAPKSRRKAKLAPVVDTLPTETSAPKKAARKSVAKNDATTKSAGRKTKANPQA